MDFFNNGGCTVSVKNGECASFRLLEFERYEKEAKRLVFQALIGHHICELPFNEIEHCRLHEQNLVQILQQIK